MSGAIDTVTLRAVMELAMQQPDGVSIERESEGSAIHFRQRLYTFRSRERKKSHKIFEPGDPSYDKTIYDSITAQVVERDGKWFVDIRSGSPTLEHLNIINNTTGEKI